MFTYAFNCVLQVCLFNIRYCYYEKRKCHCTISRWRPKAAVMCSSPSRKLPIFSMVVLLSADVTDEQSSIMLSNVFHLRYMSDAFCASIYLASQ